jgi:hypothetical protein
MDAGDSGQEAGATDSSTPETGPTDAGDGGAVPAGEIVGNVTRLASVTVPANAHTLWVVIGPLCLSDPSFIGQIDNMVMLQGIDMSSPSASIPYTMTGVTPGTYQVWGWLDNNGPGYPTGGVPFDYPDCVQVTVTASAGATANIVFDSNSN